MKRISTKGILIYILNLLIAISAIQLFLFVISVGFRTYGRLIFGKTVPVIIEHEWVFYVDIVVFCISCYFRYKLRRNNT
jgi:hypothetical protein